MTMFRSDSLNAFESNHQSMESHDSHEPACIIKHPHILAPTIRELIRRIDAVVSGQDSNKMNRLGKIMKEFPLKNRDLKKFAYVEESAPYTRNLIWETEHYALILMCWKPRTDSVIHSHGGSSCWARIVNGEVQERRFALNPDTNQPELTSDILHDIGQVTYIDDSLGLHALCNPSSAYSMSLHLYCPPIQTAQYFDSKDKKMHPCKMEYHRKHNLTST